VRSAAATVLGASDAAMRARLLAPLLADPVRKVRMTAARALAGGPEAQLPPAQVAAFRSALAEYVAAERFNADRPESRTNLGNLHALQGRFDDAAAAYRSALEIDPSFVQAAINLADLRRQLGAEAEAESILRDALRRDPRSAVAHHALGLSLWRQKRTAEAMKELAEAARLDPANPRHTYVYAVALHGAGDVGGARRELERGLKRRPGDRELLLALTLIERDAGQRDRALALVRRLAELEPDSPDVARLVQELGGP
jgi:tetratricopeptide (TPR) repeat protein